MKKRISVQLRIRFRTGDDDYDDLVNYYTPLRIELNRYNNPKLTTKLEKYLNENHRLTESETKHMRTIAPLEIILYNRTTFLYNEYNIS